MHRCTHVRRRSDLGARLGRRREAFSAFAQRPNAVAHRRERSRERGGERVLWAALAGRRPARARDPAAARLQGPKRRAVFGDAAMTRSSDDGNRKRFRLKRFAEIKVSTRPNYLIKGILPRAGLAVIWGPPKCGKSFWTFDAVMHPALGWEYRGRKVQQGPVVYCALEGGVGFSRRIEAWRQRYLAEAADGDDVPFYLLDVPLNLIADHAALIEDSSEQVGDGEPPACVVIDTLNRALAGSENKPEDMSKFIRAADAIWVAFKCLVVIVHHSGLEGSRPRGHTSLPGADEVQIQVERADNGTITPTVEHMKGDEAGATVGSRLERVELGPDDDGEIMSSCVIVACDGPAATAKAAAKDDWGKSKTVKRLRGIIMAMLAEQGTDLRPFADGPMVRVLKVEQVRTEFFKTHFADGDTEKAKQNAKRMAFKRALAAADKAIVTREVSGVEYVWLRSAQAEAQAG